jgi:hypothetical protein
MGRENTKKLLAQRSREPGKFIPLPIDLLGSEEFSQVSAHAKSVLFALCAQLRWRDSEFNNGDLCGSWSVMVKYGTRSRDTLARALRELREGGWIEVSRQGGRRQATLYAVTFLAVGHCDGKLDIGPTVRPTSRWRRSKNKSGDTPTVSRPPILDTNSVSPCTALTRPPCQ